MSGWSRVLLSFCARKLAFYCLYYLIPHRISTRLWDYLNNVWYSLYGDISASKPTPPVLYWGFMSQGVNVTVCPFHRSMHTEGTTRMPTPPSCGPALASLRFAVLLSRSEAPHPHPLCGKGQAGHMIFYSKKYLVDTRSRPSTSQSHPREMSHISWTLLDDFQHLLKSSLKDPCLCGYLGVHVFDNQSALASSLTFYKNEISEKHCVHSCAKKKKTNEVKPCLLTAKDLKVGQVSA